MRRSGQSQGPHGAAVVYDEAWEQFMTAARLQWVIHDNIKRLWHEHSGQQLVTARRF